MTRIKVCGTGKTAFYQPGGGQIQLSLIPPRWRVYNSTDTATIEKNGAMLLEGAPPDPNRDGFLDWENNKIIFALGEKDIAETLYLVSKGINVNLIHSNSDKTIVKTFKIERGNKNRNGIDTYKLVLLEKNNDLKKKGISVFITAIDLTRFMKVCEQGIPYIMGWHRT